MFCFIDDLGPVNDGIELLFNAISKKGFIKSLSFDFISIA